MDRFHKDRLGVSGTCKFSNNYINSRNRWWRVSYNITYLAERKGIPILLFDSLWYQDLGTAIQCYLKVKRVKGEGRALCVQGFVGVKID